MVTSIGQSFMNVWNNGTGVETLNNLQLLLQTLLDLIASIATAFTNAWNTGNVGEQMLQSIMNLINTVVQAVTAIGQAFIAAWNDGNAGERLLSALMQMITAVVNLVNSIGQAFITAWTQGGLGQSIFAHILSIITNIITAIKSIAENLQSAWEHNGNGVAIWTSILKIIDDVLAGIDRMSQATANWASGLNFEPLMTAFRNLWAAIEPLVDIIMNGLSWAYENVLLPFGKWTIEKAAPAVLDLLTAALQAIAKVCEALAPVLQQIWAVVKPIISFIGSAVIGAIELATQAITLLGNALERFINLLSKVGSGIGSGISSLIGAFSGTSTFALNASMPALNVPALANGAVISPNNQFLALLGDQKSGVNVETPLSTMIDAFNKALDARGGTGNNNTPINLYIDGTKFARITNAYNSSETRRRGVNLVTGGA